ncbi:MAG: sulfite exporter TauE/SafE family protein [Verrucomicrobiota bacterium]
MDYWTAFVLGLFGSLHCAGMCGPLALALPRTGRGATGYAVGRLAYNLGRIVTYCSLGAVFGLFGKTFLLAGLQQTTSIALGVLLLIGLFASHRLRMRQPLIGLVNAVKSRLALLLRQRTFASQVLLGLLNGLLPCGLVYVAAAGATATSGIMRGALYMAAFGAGTLPMMLAISLSGNLVPISLRLRLLKAVPVSVFLLAALLILRGLALGIPYLSPDLSAGQSACCH